METKNIHLYQTTELVAMLFVLDGAQAKTGVEFDLDELIAELKTRTDIGPVGQGIIDRVLAENSFAA